MEIEDRHNFIALTVRGVGGQSIDLKLAMLLTSTVVAFVSS